MNDRIDKILAKYFSGEATENELQELELWLAESEENDKYFLEMTALYQNISPKPASNFNADKAFSEFKKHVSSDEKVHQIKTRNRLNIRYWAAASVVLLITISALFLLNRNNEMILIAADNQVKELSFTESIEIALNQNSSIEYQKKNLNEVVLKGEAKFNINSEENQDFTVYAGKTIIKDIGTIFTVSANHEDDYIKVEVFEGEVLFYTEENAGISIKENESGIYYELSNTFELIVPNIETGIKSDIPLDIVFNSQSLKDVVAILQGIFDVAITIENKSLENMLLTANFNYNESLDLILNVIAETLSVQVINNGGGYGITK